MNQESFNELPKIFSTMISKVIVDDKEYNNITEWYNSLNKKEGNYTILLNIKKKDLVKVIVKSSALKDSPFFQFHKQNNNNIPIPFTEMYGRKIDEREKTQKMDLWDKEHKIHWVGWLLKSWILEECKI